RMRRSRRPLQVNSSRSLTARRQLVTGRRQLGVRRYSLRYPLPRNNGTFAPALPWNARNLSRSFEVVFVKQFNMSGSAMVRADEAAMIVSWLKVHSKSIQCSTYRQIYCTSPPRARPRVFVHVKRPCYCFEGQLGAGLHALDSVDSLLWAGGLAEAVTHVPGVAAFQGFFTNTALMQAGTQFAVASSNLSAAVSLVPHHHSNFLKRVARPHRSGSLVGIFGTGDSQWLAGRLTTCLQGSVSGYLRVVSQADL
ncbi:unnamed protein product, partial [Polarella glacialis]